MQFYMWKILSTIFIFLVFCFDSFSQDFPYQFKKNVEIPIIGYSLLCETGSLILEHNQKSSSVTDFANLSKSDINAFDRNATNNYSEELEKASKYFAFGTAVASIASVGLLSLENSDTYPAFWRNSFTFAGLYIEAMAITFTTTNLVKNCITRYRPIIYNDKVPIIKKLEKDASHSFFSRHTSLAATSTFFAASVISEYYPHSWQSRTTWIGASILPAICGILRIESGQHFPTDVITGYAFGAMCGILVPYFHKKQNEKVSTFISPFGATMVARL